MNFRQAVRTSHGACHVCKLKNDRTVGVVRVKLNGVSNRNTSFLSTEPC